MVYETETLKPLHALTKQGRETFALVIKNEGDRIIYRDRHPIKYIFEKIIDVLWP